MTLQPLSKSGIDTPRLTYGRGKSASSYHLGDLPHQDRAKVRNGATPAQTATRTDRLKCADGLNRSRGNLWQGKGLGE
jgi:hypothetical protein